MRSIQAILKKAKGYNENKMEHFWARCYFDYIFFAENVLGFDIADYHREWLEKLDSYSEAPVGDKSSHYADAGRYLSMVIQSGRHKSSNMSRERWRQLKAEYA